MTKASIRSQLQMIETLADKGRSFEAAIAEARLYRDFIQEIAESDSDLAPLATLALSSQNIKFKRGYE